MNRVSNSTTFRQAAAKIGLLMVIALPVAAQTPTLLDYIPSDALYCTISERINEAPEEPTFRNFEQSLEDWFRAMNDIVEWRILREELESLQAQMNLPENASMFGAFESERSAFAVFGLAGGIGPRIPSVLYICEPKELDKATATLKSVFDTILNYGLPVSRDTRWADESVVDSVEAGVGIPGLGLSYVAKGDLLFISTNSAIFDRVLELPELESGRLIDEPEFQALQEQLPDTYDELVFSNWGHFASTLHEIQKLTAFIQDEEVRVLVNRAADQVISLIGTFRAGASVSVWDGQTRVTTGRTLLAEERPELFEDLFRNEPARFPVFRIAPRGIESVWASNVFSVPDIWEAAWTLIDSLAPNREEIRAGFAEFEANTGLDFEEDLLSWMGQSYGAVKYPVDLESVVPMNHFAIWIEATDQEKAKAWLPKVVDTIRKSTELPIQVMASEYEGHTISSIQVPIPFFPYQPCLTIVESGVLIASHQNPLHQMLDVYDGRQKGIQTDSSYERVDSVLEGKANHIQFVDTARATRGASKTLERTAQMAALGAAHDKQAQNVAFGMGRLAKLIAIFSICQAEAEASSIQENAIVTQKQTVFRDLPARVSIPPDMRGDVSISQIHKWLPEVIRELNKNGQRELALILTQKMAQYIPERAEQAERLADEIKSTTPTER